MWGNLMRNEVHGNISEYSNHLNTKLVWYSNGRFVSCSQIVERWSENRTEKACKWSKMSGIWMVHQVMWLYHLNTGHPYCPLFRYSIFRWLLHYFSELFRRSLPKCLGGGCRISWRAKEQICWVMSNLVSAGSTRLQSRWHQNDGQWTDARLRHKISCKGVSKKLWNIWNKVEIWITNAGKQDSSCCMLLTLSKNMWLFYW